MAASAAFLFFWGQTTHASSSHRESEIAAARAENIQRHLEAKPSSARTREEYERVLSAYRSVYHGDPASPDAARSIAAVANLLADEGRHFHDAKLFHDAVAQWEFLRRQYPTNALRHRALFQEAQIQQHDLHDRAAAKATYRNFLMRYPHDPLAEQAGAELTGMENNSGPAQRAFIARAVVVRSERKPATEIAPVFPKLVASQPAAAVVSTARSFPSAQTYPPAGVHSATIQGVRYWMEGDATRLAVDMSGAVPYHVYLAPDGKQITLILFGARPSESMVVHSVSVGHDENVRSIRASILTGDQTELVLELKHAAVLSSFTLSNPNRLILDVRAASQTDSLAVTAGNLTRPALQAPIDGRPSPAGSGNAKEPLPELTPRAKHFPAADRTMQVAPVIIEDTPLSAVPAASAEPTAGGQRSMARVLGLRVRRIVIDAGHGGHDSGTLGPGGLEEKDVALDVALRLGHLLHQRLGADIIYTRRSDRFVPLEERTAIANRAHADLFLSIHANSSADPDVRGVETYFLNFTGSPDALQVAARENAISNRSVHELSDLVRKIALSDKIGESREFAADVQQSLYSGLASGNDGLRNRGVKQAPFVVLIGANMPSILAEISFLTNPEDANELAQAAYRERLAEALYRGVAQYVDGMSGVRVAKTVQPEAPQSSAE